MMKENSKISMNKATTQTHTQTTKTTTQATKKTTQSTRVKIPSKILVTITFLIMLTVNALANILPINGQGTGAVSDSYPNLFAPAGITFAIWGLIYLLLLGFTLYHCGLFQSTKDTMDANALGKIGIVFAISSLLNSAWIFAWHYNQIIITIILMAGILLCLILINQTIINSKLSTREKIFVRLPFSVYFGWITVATIANATALFVSLDLNLFSVISETSWTVGIIVIGMIIGVITMIKNRDVAYGLVFVWAYSGILIKHTSTVNGFSSKYPIVIITVIACVFIFLVAEIYILISKKRLNR